jgi:hypothetical protein
MPRFLPAEIARRAGVHRSTVSRQLRQWPHLIDEAGTVDLDEYLAARATDLSPALQRRATSPAAVLPIEQAGPSYAIERARREAAQARLAEIELDEREGRIVTRDAVATAASRVFGAAIARLQEMMQESAVDLAGITDPAIIAERLGADLRRAMARLHEELMEDATRRAA